MKRPGQAAASALLALILASCTEGKRPFLLVQMCLPGAADDFQRLKANFVSFAEMHDLDFSDGSAEQTELSKRLAVSIQPGIDVSTLGDQLQLSLDGADDFSAGAANIPDDKEPVGLSGSPNQVVIGFNASRETARTRELVSALLDQLEQHWDIVTVPPDRGAFLLEDCPPSQ